MKIGGIGYTHGDQLAIRRAVAAVGEVAMWLHTGDYSQEGEYLAQVTGLPVTVAAGNCDGQTTAKVDEFVEIAGKRIWLTHGHRYRVKYGLQELEWWGRQYNADIVVYGHTHIADLVRHSDMILFNPGSAAQPRWNKPTCGLLEITQEGNIDAKIIEL